MEKKYELVQDDTIEVNSFGCLKVLYRIKALKDFNDVKKGDLGGYIEKEDNLSHEDNCWISGDAKVFGNAQVSGNACVYNNAKIYSNAHITNINDYIVIGPIGGRNDFTTFYLTKDKEIMVSCGCFNDTIDEFIKAVNKTYKNNDKYKKQYLSTITYAKTLID